MDSTASSFPTEGYAATSDLSRLCLPQEYKDSNRRLAWVNSICCLFLIIGMVGLKPPPVIIRELTEITEVVPIIITPPEEPPPPPKAEDEPPPEETTTETAPDIPVVATVVAANASAVAFAVPVEGPVVLAPVRFAPPPPPVTKAPPKEPNQRVALTAAEEDWGGASSQPEYPGMALRNGYQGKVLLEITFDASGAVQLVKIAKSSGHTILDNAAAEKVRRHLRLRVPPGESRVFTKEFTFRLQ